MQSFMVSDTRFVIFLMCRQSTSLNTRATPQQHCRTRPNCVGRLLAALISIALLPACGGNDRGTSGHLFKQGDSKSALHCQRHSSPFAYSQCQISSDAIRLGKYDGSKPATASIENRLHLYWRDASQNPYYNFASLQNELKKNQQQLTFAINAGMYNTEFAPIGYTVIEGKQLLSLNQKQGGGNFHLLPNGVFWGDETGVYVTQTSEFATLRQQQDIQPVFATQSGPMLVIDGQIHPKFDPVSTSKKFRTGVGTCEQIDSTTNNHTQNNDKNQQLQFVISDSPVNFYQFAELFKDTLHCDNALFLDGGIASAMYAPQIHRHDQKNMGVMIAITQSSR